LKHTWPIPHYWTFSFFGIQTFQVLETWKVSFQKCPVVWADPQTCQRNFRAAGIQLGFLFFCRPTFLKTILASRTSGTFGVARHTSRPFAKPTEPLFANARHKYQRMKIYIKNMVCNRCIMVVKNELEKLGFLTLNIGLGEVELKNDLTETEKTNLDNHLKTFGFELIDDKKSRLIGQIKSFIIEIIHQNNSELKSNLSDYLSSKIHHDYTYLSNLFSEIEGTTIEKYFIAQKIEKVKELLVYDELSLSEIAYQMNYSSVGYLSNQFKKVTGLTPTHFKNIKENKRKPIDEV